MEQQPKNQEEKDVSKEELDEKDVSKEEELEELREVIKKLEEMSKNQPSKKPGHKIIAIEFGGVFHHNRIVNFIFTFILTFTTAFFISELFNFIRYRDIIYFAGAILLFLVFEEMVKTYVLIRYFKIVLRTFGAVFYFIYLFMFFVIDQYILVDTFNFINEITLSFFVLFLAIVRYSLGQAIRTFLRYQTLR